ncbi:MAG: metalloregulator ArsR/SmtB family transcription factor [Myxococcales bacterium]|nr:metalloregulator ArsR/SmtB family transcription factor [Myxococcales bacterium]
MPTVDSTVELLHLFGDATRVRLLALLSDAELSVAELTSITELPQSRVSTHLGRLREAGLLRDRKVGASTLYAVNDASMPREAGRVWELVRADIDDTLLEADRARRERMRRAAGSTSWPESIAGEMERHYSPGRTWEATARAFLGFLKLGDVLDLGSGDGAIADLLAPRSSSITCVDRSERVVEAARRRLAHHPNVSVVVSDMHSLELPDASFDQVLLLNTLTYAEQPDRALSEASRVLRPGGTLALVTLAAHSHGDVTAAYGHVRAGFEPKALGRLLVQAELDVIQCQVTSRERTKPYFEVVTAFATRPDSESEQRAGKNAPKAPRTRPSAGNASHRSAPRARKFLT